MDALHKECKHHYDVLVTSIRENVYCLIMFIYDFPLGNF